MNALWRKLGLGLALVAFAPSLAQADVKPKKAAPLVDDAPAARHGRAHAKLVGVANLNDASEEVLELLPGIGEVRAGEIMTFRAKHPFKKVDDLRRIKGIGRKTLAKLRPFLSVSGKSTLTDENAAPDPKQDDFAKELAD